MGDKENARDHRQAISSDGFGRVDRTKVEKQISIVAKTMSIVRWKCQENILLNLTRQGVNRTCRLGQNGSQLCSDSVVGKVLLGDPVTVPHHLLAAARVGEPPAYLLNDLVCQDTVHDISSKPRGSISVR